MDEWLQKLGSLPWLAQPGERWMYHVSGDVLGALIARVSGQPLSRFMRECIFDPLGMKDTAFHVPPEKRDRLPELYFFNRRTNKLEVYDDVPNSAWRSEPPAESGGGGLVSTIDGYFAFSRMMLNKGRYGREHILSCATVELMTADQLTPAQRAGCEIFFGTTAYIDPAHAMIGILFGILIASADASHSLGRLEVHAGRPTDARNQTVMTVRRVGNLFTWLRV